MGPHGSRGELLGALTSKHELRNATGLRVTLVGVALLISGVIGTFIYLAERERVLTNCAAGEPPGTGVHVEWEWLPPRLVCVYHGALRTALPARRLGSVESKLNADDQADDAPAQPAGARRRATHAQPLGGSGPGGQLPPENVERL